MAGPTAELRAATTREGFALAEPGFKFAFPRDHGSHPEFKIEWWYITGHLFSDTDRRFGFQATFFRSAVHPPSASAQPDRDEFGTNQVYLAHMAVLDAKTGTFLSEERLNRDGWDAYSRTNDLDVRNGNWTLRRQPMAQNPERMKLQGSILGRALFEMELTPAKPRVLFGQEGVSRKGAEESAASHYITFPRLSVKGELTLDGQALLVHGEAWMDHEISSSQLGTNQVGWDWASLQLQDGREIMVYVMRTKSGAADPHSSLTWIDQAGRLTRVQSDGFTWKPLRRWRSSKTGAQYPVEIELITIDPATGVKASLRLKPVADDQELIGKIGGISYWEGACDVRSPDNRAVGRAYLELTGYADSMEGKLK